MSGLDLRAWMGVCLRVCSTREEKHMEAVFGRFGAACRCVCRAAIGRPQGVCRRQAARAQRTVHGSHAARIEGDWLVECGGRAEHPCVHGRDRARVRERESKARR